MSGTFCVDEFILSLSEWTSNHTNYKGEKVCVHAGVCVCVCVCVWVCVYHPLASGII